jgi:proline iminopeptidase
MKCIRILIILVMVFLPALFTSCIQDETAKLAAEKEGQETIFDKIVHIEPELVTEIPEVSRWCDRLKLKKYRINVGDAELYVEEEGKGMPLVLINGGPGGTHHYFHPWFSQAKKYARLIYYDQRGCGLSDFKPGENGYSVEQAVKDLEALRKALNVDKWIVLGYSYGGFLAQYYTIHYPENMAGLVLLGASTGMWVEMKPSRQQEFISNEERARMREIGKQLQDLAKDKEWPYEKYLELLIYNNNLNGDWKRQNYYKPSKEKFVQIALYEWKPDKNNFRGGIQSSQQKVDLTGAFENCPVPTLITEGRWDLTWNTDKPGILHKNHPGAELVLFEKAGHDIYEDESVAFFKILKRFVKTLPEVTPDDVAAYKEYLMTWKRKDKASPDYILSSSGWGRSSNKKLVEAYSKEWLNQLKRLSNYMKLGFALYDYEDYEESLLVFEKMLQMAQNIEDKEYAVFALIWQGHMLDLLGKRDLAVACYKQVVEMNISDRWTHSQFELTYDVTPYAKERIESPFKRIENKDKD